MPALPVTAAKRIFRAAVSQNARSALRQRYDALFCRAFEDKETLGKADSWTIRTHDLRPGAIVYSGGVGEDISFELELVRRFGVQVVMFDPSEVGRKTVASLLSRAELDGIQYQPLGLAGKSGGHECAAAGAEDGFGIRAGVGLAVECTTIAAEMRARGHDLIDLLKLDIEGFEYEVLEDCLRRRIPIRQLCVEFHHFFPDIPHSRTRQCISALRAAGLRVIHKSQCNYTFYSDHPMGAD
jgi:FkbM family methyltransferase